MDEGVGVENDFQFLPEARGRDGIESARKPFADDHNVRNDAEMFHPHRRPVRPRPVWTSSMMSRALARSQISRTPGR